MKEKRRLNRSNCSFHFCTSWGKQDRWEWLPPLVSSLRNTWTCCTSPLRRPLLWPLCWGMFSWCWLCVWTGLSTTPPSASSCRWPWLTSPWVFWSSPWQLSSARVWTLSSTHACSFLACCWSSPSAPSFPCWPLPSTDIYESRFPPGEELKWFITLTFNSLGCGILILLHPEKFDDVWNKSSHVCRKWCDCCWTTPLKQAAFYTQPLVVMKFGKKNLTQSFVFWIWFWRFPIVG